ncbi:HDOD domain-containing protein [Undibacterium oligocarboniphilum]|uniref:HDOD domain-containing protein n=1 Tax=Undibacterium oligocarboniphilum TaxID=666702 RepID=A0A850QCR2_9BURK|nr:HDOD domain-containing protein [Undibacterium oligocarboniphilum]MBC3869758.1 HDOD domain-containing protein [Undibacterium oligocarboniphilum]NVO77361.1 HDOD domain-containing protein [Undibacterium oligocarboniphilum]
MTPASKTSVANDQSVDALIKTIRIPPRPSMLADVQAELSSREPDPRRLAATISHDVSLSASLLKLTNSSFFGLRLKASSVDHAVQLLGMQQCGLLMTGIIARQSIQIENVSLIKFWDFSSKRAQAMSYLAGCMRVCPVDLAHTFGLFCDIGIPILMERFPDYQQTLELAYQQLEHKFTFIEQEKHHTSHTSIGALMARTWGLPEEVCSAILLHHDYAVLQDTATSERVRALVALSLVAEYAIHKYHGQETLAEWEKGGQQALDFLGLASDELEDRLEELHELFNHVH